MKDLEKQFLNYFVSHKHKLVNSSSLIGDPTLMFTNSGMVQFKDIFTGKQKPTFLNATSSQNCVRAGGKHNDLDNVGHTKRHHTFFQMLGNFSFGDYFKEQSITYAWNFLTNDLKIDSNRLYATVYHTDHESFDLWKKITGWQDNKIIKINTQDNFWSMGDTGPCGPCSEIFYDHGEHLNGGLPGSLNQDGDRFVEIWNMVFMQYEKRLGELRPLDVKCIDTGMGLERIAAVVQGVDDNYDIDIFQSLIKDISSIFGLAINKQNPLYFCYKIIADHMRSIVFIMMEGVVPSNEGRGYVLRRIIRRTAWHAYLLQSSVRKEILIKLHELAFHVIAVMQINCEVIANIKHILYDEEERFLYLINKGKSVIFDLCNKNPSMTKLNSKTGFELYDTHGFPIDLIKSLLTERQVEFDEEGFDKEMLKQKNMGKSSWIGSGDTVEFDEKGKSKLIDWKAQLETMNLKTEFVGYEAESYESEICGLVVNNRMVDKINLDLQAKFADAQEAGLQVKLVDAQETELQTKSFDQVVKTGTQDFDQDVKTDTQDDDDQIVKTETQDDATFVQNQNPTQIHLNKTSINHELKFLIITKATPFYAESGGQGGDIGIIKFGNIHFQVTDTQKFKNIHLHFCEIKKVINSQDNAEVGYEKSKVNQESVEAGYSKSRVNQESVEDGYSKSRVSQENSEGNQLEIKIGDLVKMEIDTNYRNGLKKHHTATHLLHSALRKALGAHITQRGSFVGNNILRFDFNANAQLSKTQIFEIEQDINRVIDFNYQVETKIQTLDEAKRDGAIGLFGDKYENEVRVIKVHNEIQDYSTELCGGTHVNRTGEIGLFTIISERSISAGIRRIEAKCGLGGFTTLQKSQQIIDGLIHTLSTDRENIQLQIKDLIESNKTKLKEIQNLKLQIFQTNLEFKSFDSHLIYVKEINEDAGFIKSLVEKNSKTYPEVIFCYFNGSKFVLSSNKAINAKEFSGRLLEHLGHGKGGGNNLTYQGDFMKPMNQHKIFEHITYILKTFY